MEETTNTEWLLEGFRYDLESTKSDSTVKYYCGEVRRFLQWAKTTAIPSDIRLITKHHIQAKFLILDLCWKREKVWQEHALDMREKGCYILLYQVLRARIIYILGATYKIGQEVRSHG